MVGKINCAWFNRGEILVIEEIEGLNRKIIVEGEARDDN